MHSEINIAEEPRGETYQALLRFAVSRCQRFSLVWCDQLAFHPAAWEVASTLEPYLVARVRTDAWPGTQLLGHQATVGYYQSTPEAVAVLETAHGLYSWLSPLLPEDLAFYSSEGKLWLGSISHERDAWFQTEELSRAEILQSVPGLILTPAACYDPDQNGNQENGKMNT
jgi:hypothetical protein